jgi:hypothetical protein
MIPAIRKRGRSPKDSSIGGLMGGTILTSAIASRPSNLSSERGFTENVRMLNKKKKA